MAGTARRATAWLALMACASTGCALAKFASFLLPEASMPPKVELLTSRRATKKIVCVPFAEAGLRFSFDSLDSDLNKMLCMEIGSREKRFEVVPEQKVGAWRDQNPNWADMSLQSIGEHFDADFVFFYEVRRFSLNETKNQFLLQGGANVRVKIHDVAKDNTVLEDGYQREYPPERSVPVSAELSEETFRKKFLRTIARELSWYILPHRIADEISDL